MFQKATMASRLAFNAVLIAVYVVLTFLVIPIGGLKITFEHFPVILCAVLFGPVDAMLVGGVGELLNQLTSYGFTPTTLLWVLPIVFRGLSVGICAKLLKNQMSPLAIMKVKVPIVFYMVSVITGICSSCLNTYALYVDSKMFGYYNYAMVFGALLVRILLGVATSILIGVCIKTVLYALRKGNFI